LKPRAPNRFIDYWLVLCCCRHMCVLCRTVFPEPFRLAQDAGLDDFAAGILITAVELANRR
jgi:hypothetical protein